MDTDVCRRSQAGRKDWRRVDDNAPWKAIVTNLAQALSETAAEHGDRPAVRLDDMVLTYDELLEGSRRVTALLADREVGPGDRVGLVLPNVPPFPVLFYGAVAAGAVVVPMNPLLKAREVGYHLADSGAGLVFTAPMSAEQARTGATSVDADAIVVDEAFG